MKVTFFKTGRPKQFNFIPRYYDEQKEESDKRRKRIESELGIKDGSEAYRSTLQKGVMSHKLAMKRKSNRGSIIRLLVIITILTLMMLYLLSGDFTFNFLPK